MRDIPVFATELGVASLFLKDIPYWGAAYIKIQSTAQPKVFLKECVDFCRAAGAQRIFASGDACVGDYPHYTDIYQMCRGNFSDDEFCAVFPVQEHTLKQWLEIYNHAMERVPNAAYMTQHDCMELIKEKSAYFVHASGALLGIGIASGDKIPAVISCQKGAGERVLKALCSTLDADTIYLEVASNNEPAMRLYERLGFLRTKVLASWYQVQ